MDSDVGKEINGKSVYEFFVVSEYFQGELYEDFRRESGRIKKLKSKYPKRSKEKIYYVEEKSEACKLYYESNNNSVMQHDKVDLFLINIEGIITNKRNKSHFLKTMTKTPNNSQIIAVTETWAKEHFNAEYKKAFNEYNIMRADRDVKLVPEDKERLRQEVDACF